MTSTRIASPASAAVKVAVARAVAQPTTSPPMTPASVQPMIVAACVAVVGLAADGHRGREDGRGDIGRRGHRGAGEHVVTRVPAGQGQAGDLDANGIPGARAAVKVAVARAVAQSTTSPPMTPPSVQPMIVAACVPS